MKSWGSTGIIMITTLVVIMLVAVNASSVITGESTSETSSQEDIDQMTKEVVDEISTYIQIKDSKGKFYKTSGVQKIEKIALLISPLVSQEIDMTQLTIQIDNGEIVRTLYYTNNSAKIFNQSLFGNSLWDEIDTNKFGLISMMDLDESITKYNVINENSDTAYLVFNLPSDMYMKKYDTIKVTLFPSTGITRTVILKAPMPMTSVITFE